MSKNKLNLNIEYFVYIIIILIGLVFVFLYKFNIEETQKKLRIIAEQEAEKEIKDSINNLIMIIDSRRSSEFSKYDEKTLDSETKKKIDDEIKSEFDEIIRNLDFYKNQYFWVNEVINYEGGDNYAIRRIHQNLVNTEGCFLSTNTRDFNNKKPYLTELEGMIQNGELLQKYYFKNKVDDRIVEKLSYAKLYEPYNWIIATGIPLEDIYYQANLLKEKCKTLSPFIYFIIFCFVFVSCLLFYLYSKKRELKNNEQLAIKENNFKSEFVANVTHDLRTPLNALIGLTSLLNNDKLEKDETREYLSKIDISSKYLLSLVDEILDISAIEDGKMVLKNENFNLKDIIYPINNLFYIQSKEKGINFNCYCENIIYENLKGDVFRLKQIISNLLSNAIKFTNSGGFVNLIIKQELDKNNNLILSINVIDNGVGISKDKLDIIFNKFEQTSADIKNIYGGSGLGLSIVNKLVLMMNGTIDVKSSKNNGSNFEIKVYIEENNKENNKENNIKLSNKKILYIDEEYSSKLFSAICKDLNLECNVENNIEKGLLKLKKSTNKKIIYDYIIISIDDSNISFKNNFKEFLNLVDTKFTTVILISYQDNMNYKNFNHAFLKKPILKSDLVKLINEGLIKYKTNNKLDEKKYDNLKVLVAEDNEINRFVIRKILLAKNVLVDTVENGEQAFEKFVEKGDNYYDLIFMDYKMPILDGVKATKFIRGYSYTYSKNVIIYAMTANTYTKDIDNFYLVGMNGYFSKPIDVDKIYQILNKIYINKNNKLS